MVENDKLFLESLDIAAPCTASWEEMSGDEKVRFCGSCSKNVYNLSVMSRKDAEKLVREKEGRLCIRMYRRADGTVVNDNCPVGLRAVRDRLRRVGGGIAAIVSLFLSGGAAQAGEEKSTCEADKSTQSNSIQGDVAGPNRSPKGTVKEMPTMGKPAAGHALMGSPPPVPPKATLGETMIKMGEIGPVPVTPADPKARMIADYSAKVLAQISDNWKLAHPGVKNMKLILTFDRQGKVTAEAVSTGSGDLLTDEAVLKLIHSLTFPALPEGYQGETMVCNLSLSDLKAKQP